MAKRVFITIFQHWKQLSSRMRSATRIFYNRVPKCASKFIITLLTVAQEVSSQRYKLYHSKKYNKFRLNNTEMNAFLTEIDAYDRTERPWVFDQHTYFVNFKEHNRTNPLYINVVRKPIDLLFSKYHFRRRRDFDPEKMSAKRHNMTYDDCVFSNQYECTARYAFRVGSVPYFCGQAEVCTKPSKEAVQVAKRNVNRYYGVVALMEDLMNGIALLEQTTPKLFKGMTAMAASMINRRINKRKKKAERPAKALAIMEERLQYDNELYAFLKQRYMLFKRYFQTESFVKQTLGSINQTVPGHS